MIDDLRSSGASRNPDAIRLNAHSLKGAALTIGAAQLAEGAFAMENMARDRELGEIDSALERWIAIYNVLTPMLQQAMETPVVGR